MFTKAKLFISLILCLQFFQGSVEAKKPYSAKVTVPPNSATINQTSLSQLMRSLKDTNFAALFPNYTPNSPASIKLNLRGLLATATFAANSTTVVLTIPNSNIMESFTGATRGDSAQLMKNFLTDDAISHHNLLNTYARTTPIDPIAGNPNSVLALLAQSDYALGRLSPLSNCYDIWSAQPITHQFQTGAKFIRAFCHEFDTTNLISPLRYSYCPENNWALIIDSPLSLLINGGAYSVVGSVGAGFRFPITFEWSLTTTVRDSFGGSVDLVAAGNFFSTGLISDYSWCFCDFIFSLTNSVTYSTSTNLFLGGTNFNYHLHNWIFKNGVTLTTCDQCDYYGYPVNFNLWFVDSLFRGDSLFIEHYDEVGVNMILNNILPCLEYDCLSVGFSYQFGERKYKGYCFNSIYQF